MRRTLFLARHGETDWNAQYRWQGHTDVPLNDAGRAQALVLAERVRGVGLGAVVASDLARARETAEIVARTLGIGDVAVDAGFRERRFGVFEGLTREECERQYPDEWERYRSGLRVMPPGAEPHEEVTTRMLAAVGRAIAAVGGRPDPLLVVSHGGALRLLIGAVTGAEPPPIGNAAVFRAHVFGEDWELVEPFAL